MFVAPATLPTTVTITVSGALVLTPSDTTSWNVRSPFGAAAGTVNVGAAVVVLDNTTAVPPVCVHWYVIVRPSGSLLALPLRPTDPPGLAVTSGPAFAIGGAFVVPET